MSESSSTLQDQVAKFKGGIREIVHEMNNCLGMLRTATYLVEMSNDEAKRKHYLSMMNAGIDKLEESLKRLRTLRENPDEYPTPTPPTGQQ